jgi:hypothetical protein
LRLGLQDTVGVIFAGSQRADFPTAIEMPLLRIATNQAAIELQEVRRLSEQRRAAEELRFQAGLLDAVDQAVIAANIYGSSRIEIDLLSNCMVGQHQKSSAAI